MATLAEKQARSRRYRYRSMKRRAPRQIIGRGAAAWPQPRSPGTRSTIVFAALLYLVAMVGAFLLRDGKELA